MVKKDSVTNLIRQQFLSDLEGSSPEVRRVRLFWCDHFLKMARDRPLSEWNKSLATQFMRKLEKDKYTPLTVRNAMGVVTRVYDAAKIVHEQERNRLISSVDARNPTAVAEVMKAMALPGPQWDMGKRFLPAVNTKDISKPEMPPEDLMRMVEAARGGKLEPPEVAFLAISSIYGFRAGELRAIHLEDINYDAETIWRSTEKGGEQRKQALATQIIPYLQKYEFDLEYSPFMINKVFHSICDKTGVKTVYHQGWHSLRHRVDVDIQDTFAGLPELKMRPDLAAHIFLCWKLSTSSEMNVRYYTKDPLEVDHLVLKYSPLVRLWE